MESSSPSSPPNPPAAPGVNGWRLIVALAGVVIVVAGLQLASSLLVPLAAAVFFAVLCIPPMNWLQERKVPQWLAVVMVFVVVLIVFVIVGFIVNKSISGFLSRLPEYQAALQERLEPIDPIIEQIGLGEYINPLLGARQDAVVDPLVDGAANPPVDGAAKPPVDGAVDPPTKDAVDPPVEGVLYADQVKQAYEAETGGVGDPSNLLPFITRALRALSSVMSNTVFVMLVVVFILAEAAGLPRKFRIALTNPEADLRAFSGIVNDLQTYIKVKALLSLLTGILAGLLCWVVGTDYPVLWGLLAFLLNFIPTFGSILAAIPPVVLTWLMLDWEWAVVVLVGYLLINNVLGNFVEPRMMGTRLGLSTLVVFLSMVFWGWVWGPVGMVLSVPLTMIVKIMLQHSTDLSWMAVLLASDAEVRERERTMRDGSSSSVTD